MLRELPIFGVCGHSGSGKTTLIETLLARLIEKKLSVAVAKFHAHGICVDTPGKDSDRFFRTGADVWIEGPDEGFVRTQPTDPQHNVRRLVEFARAYDVVLLEGRKKIDCEKVWLLAEDETDTPPEAGDVIATLPWNGVRAETTWKILEEWLPGQWLKPPVFGCVLIGGKSTRMGRAKHLLRHGDATWLEHVHAALGETCERVVVVGSGELPDDLKDATRLGDVPDAAGPLAGILAAMRWAPFASWVVSACDLPNVTPEAFQWLLSTRAPGVWATIPRRTGRENVEPLLAHYDFRARALLEQLLREGRSAPRHLAGRDKVISPQPPAQIADAWENLNTPEDLTRNRPNGKS